MKLKAVFTLILTLSFQPIFCQQKMALDTLLLGNLGLDVANYIIPTADKGFMAAGYMATDSQNQYSGVLIKLNSNMEVTWMKKYGDHGDNRAWSVNETSDKGFIVTGFSNRFSKNDDHDVWVFKVNAEGKLMWEFNYGGTGEDLSWDIKPTSDGNYIIAAQTNSKGLGNYDAWILKISGSGEIMWDKTYGTAGRERVFSIAVDQNDNVFATGIHTPGPARGPIDVYTLAVSSNNGELQWEDYLDWGKDDTGHGVVEDNNGGVWVTGYTTSKGAGGQDGFLLSYNEKGEPSKPFIYGRKGQDRLMNVIRGQNNSLWLVGYSSSFSESFDIWYIQTTDTGHVIMESSLNGAGDDRAVHLAVGREFIAVAGTYIQTNGTRSDPQLIIYKARLK